MKYVSEARSLTIEYDALPLDAIELFPLPTRLNPANSGIHRRLADVYGYAYSDMDETHVRICWLANNA